ncbi:MAG: amidohydrolase family protein [Phycisphaerae bacterium]
MPGSWTIRGAELLDDRHDRVRADVRIAGGRIRRIAARLGPADRDLDATGLTLSPGFIDIHCHSGFAALLYPRAESKVLAGVTTDVSGNCGTSPFPLTGEVLARRRDEWQPRGLLVDWSSPAEYFDRAEAAPSSVNRALLAGHGTLRAVVVGYPDRPTTADERRTMRWLLAEALEAGAVGLSSGLIYPPGCYADVEELADLAAVAADAGGIYSSHIRSEGDGLIEAVEEFLAVVRRAGVRGQLSHLKASGPSNWPKARRAVERLRAARADGLAVTADRYPYLRSMTSLDAFLLPNWAFEGGREVQLARLADAATRRRIAEAFRSAHPDEAFFGRITVAAVHPDGPQTAVGKTLRELGEEAGRDPLEVGLDLLREHEAQVDVTYASMSEDNLRLILAEPYVAVGSDAGLRNLPDAANGPPRGLAHPRAYGTAGRFLGTYVREAGLMDWQEGIRRLTSLPADVLGLAGRGRLEEGAWADLVLFDRERIHDRATYDHPWATPAGIRHVVVAGEPVVRDGRHTGATPGRLLRRDAQ